MLVNCFHFLVCNFTYPFLRSGESGFRLQHIITTPTAIPVTKTMEQPTIMYITTFDNPRPSALTGTNDYHHDSKWVANVTSNI